MKSVYQRENLRITEFDTEDVIATSGTQTEPATTPVKKEIDNKFFAFNLFEDLPSGGWFK